MVSETLGQRLFRGATKKVSSGPTLGQRLFQPKTMEVDGQEEPLPTFGRGLDQLGFPADPNLRALQQSEATAQHEAGRARLIENVLRPAKGAVAGIQGAVGGMAELTGTEPAFLTEERLGGLQRRMAPEAETTFQQVLEGVGQTLPLMATAPASLPVAAGMGALQHAHGAFQNTLQATGDEGEARKALVLNLPVGLLESALPGLSRLPGASKILSRLAPILTKVEERSGGALSRAVLGAGAEAATEGTQRILENAIARYATSEERALWDGVTQEGEVGGWVGGILNLALGRRAPKTRLEESLNRSASMQRGGAAEGLPPSAAPPGSPASGSFPGAAEEPGGTTSATEQRITQPEAVKPTSGPEADEEMFARLEREVPGYAEAVRPESEPGGVSLDDELRFVRIDALPRPERRRALGAMSAEERGRYGLWSRISDEAVGREIDERLGIEQPAPSPLRLLPKEPEPLVASAEGAPIQPTQEEIPPALPPPRSQVEQLGAFPPPLLSKKGPSHKVPEEVNEGFDIPDETLFRRAQRVAQDALNRIRIVQGAVEEQGGVRTQDIAGKADLFSGKMEEHQRRLNEEILKPLKDTAGRGDITLSDIDEFLMARHAPTRNAIILERTKGKLDSGSGMSDAEAAAVLEKHKASPRMARIGEIVDAMNRETRAMLVDSGIISQETADAWVEQFGDHYIPLKTAIEGQIEGSGRGFSVPRAPFSKRAKGRSSLADSPLTFSVLQYQQAAFQAERNRVGQSVLEFVSKNEDENQWRVYDPGKRPKDLPPLVPERTFTVKVAGEPQVIEFADPLLARGLLGLGRTHGGRLMQALGSAARAYSRLQTSWDPNFIVTNFARDIQTAGLNLTTEESKGFAAKVTNPKSVYKAIRGIYKVLREPKATGAYEDAFKEMRRAGGKVGWFYHKDFAQQFQAIEADLASLEGEGSLRKTWRGLRQIGDAIDTMNSAVENGVRLSAYLEAKKRGLSSEEAAKLSRALTIDFNKRGEWGSALNIAYLFYNASIQGSARLATAIAKNPKRGAKMVGAIASLGALNAWLNYVLGGEDEDGIPFYDKIPEHTKDRNFVFLIPGWLDEDGKPKHVKIPMPYGYSFFHALGRNAVEVGLGTKKAGEASKSVVMHGAQNFSPIGNEATFTQLVSPTLVDPFVQVSENKTFYGSPIYPDDAYDPYPKPDSQRFFSRGVSETSKEIASALNRYTGGDEFTPGALDVSPETLDHFFDFLVGGAGRTGRRTIQATNQALSGELPEYHEIPLWRSIVGEHYNAYDRDRFYSHLDEMKILEERMRRAKGGSLSNRDTPESRELLRENRAAWRLRDEYHRKVGGKASLQDRLKEAKDKKDEKAEAQIYLDFNKRWREATGRSP